MDLTRHLETPRGSLCASTVHRVRIILRDAAAGEVLVPERLLRLIIDKLPSYGVAFRSVMPAVVH